MTVRQGKCKVCDAPIEIKRGHRPREYCSNVCKRTNYNLDRIEQAALETGFNDRTVARVRNITRIAEE